MYDTPLHRAACDGDTARVMALIAEGANVNARDEDGRTPLHWASSNGHTACVEALVTKGADVNARDKDGRTPLHLAGRHGHTECAALLNSNGADVNSTDKSGRTPLYLAARDNHTCCAKFLIANGADVNASDKDRCEESKVKAFLTELTSSEYTSVLRIGNQQGTLKPEVQLLRVEDREYKITDANVRQSFNNAMNADTDPQQKKMEIKKHPLLIQHLANVDFDVSVFRHHRGTRVKLTCPHHEVEFIVGQEVIPITDMSIHFKGNDLATWVEGVSMTTDSEDEGFVAVVWRDLNQLLDLAEEAIWTGFSLDSLMPLQLSYHGPPNEVAGKHQRMISACEEAMKKHIDSFTKHTGWLLLLPNQLANTLPGSDQGKGPISEHLAQTIKSVLKSSIPSISTATADRLSLADEVEKSAFYLSMKPVINIVFYKDCPAGANKDADEHRLPDALCHVAIAEPARFQVLFCSINTSRHEVNRFQRCMEAFPNAEYFVIGFEHLPDALKAVLMNRLKSQAGTKSLTILTAKTTDVTAFLRLIHHNVLEKLQPYTHPICNDDNATQFVLGNSGAGKSHYISSITPSPLYLKNSGDSITIDDIVAFVKSLGLDDKTPTQTERINVWINIDQSMLMSNSVPKGAVSMSTSTKEDRLKSLQANRDSSKLLELNRVLWMLLVCKTIETPVGEVIPVPPHVRFLIEVAPFTNSFHFSEYESDSKQDTMMGMTYLPFAYVGLSKYKVVKREGGRKELIASLNANPDSPFRARLLFAARAIRMVYSKFEQTRLVRDVDDAFAIFDKAIGDKDLIIKPQDGKAEFHLLPANIYSHCGKFRALIDAMKHNLLFSNDPERLSYVKKKSSDALNTAAALIVKGVVDRWSENCEVSLKKLAEYGTLLYINHQFIPYPLTSFPEGNAIRTTFAPFRESLIKSMRQKVPSSHDESPNIANVVIGNCFESDVKDVIAVWEDRGIVTVEDILVRLMCCTERQHAQAPMIVAGATGVGKSFLIDTLFSVQIRKAQRKAMEVLDAFMIAQIEAAGKNANKTDPKDIRAKFATILSEGLLPGTLPQAWKLALIELEKTPVLNYPAMPSDLSKTATLERYENLQTIITYFEQISLKETSFKIVIHPDISEEDILMFIEAPTQLARALCSDTSADYVRDLVVPVLFDESNNSSRCAGLIKSLLIDQRNPRTGLRYGDSEKLWFIGAINTAGGHYATQVTHPSLVPHQCQFMSIIEDQQEKYIEKLLNSTVNKQLGKLGGVDDSVLSMLTKIINDLQAQCHTLFVEGKYSHAVSQRDLHRVVWLMETINELLKDNNTDANNNDVDVRTKSYHFASVAVTAIHYTYVARFPQTSICRADLQSAITRLVGEKSEAFNLEVKDVKDLDKIRQELLKTIVNRENFKIDDDIALTDTLRENIFATLLACMSPIHKKMPVAIIGESGMGKTLSSRIVEWNLKGTQSQTLYCQKLPKGDFRYIQGSSTTTSKQVDKVCSRAKASQLKEKDSACTVLFDINSAANVKLVHKALHEPVDSKIISLVILSNKAFDDQATQNRFLVIWNQDLKKEEVMELTLSFLGAVDAKLVEALADSFIAISSKVVDQTLIEEGKGANWNSLYQTRDYICLLRHLRSVLRSSTLAADFKNGILYNYGSPFEGMLGEVLQVFREKLKDCIGDIDTDVPPTAVTLTRRFNGLTAHDAFVRPRSLMVVSPTRGYECTENIVRVLKESDAFGDQGGGRCEVITLSNFPDDITREEDCRQLRTLRDAMRDGHHLIIRNPSRIVCYLHDLLNHNFKLFRIAFVYDSKSIINEIKAGNTPILSRCEKYLVEAPQVTDTLMVIQKQVERFVAHVSAHRFQTFDDQFTIPSYITSTGEGAETQEHVFHANARLLTLMPLADIFAILPSLNRGYDYFKSVVLHKARFSLQNLLTFGQKANAIVIASTSDVLGLQMIISEPDRLVINIDEIKSVEDLKNEIREASTGTENTIILRTAKYQGDAATICLVRELIEQQFAGGWQRKHRHKRVLLLTGPDPCMTATVEEHWVYAHLEHCTPKPEENQLLEVLAGLQPNADVSKRVVQSFMADRGTVDPATVITTLFAGGSSNPPGVLEEILMAGTQSDVMKLVQEAYNENKTDPLKNFSQRAIRLLATRSTQYLSCLLKSPWARVGGSKLLDEFKSKNDVRQLQKLLDLVPKTDDKITEKLIAHCGSAFIHPANPWAFVVVKSFINRAAKKTASLPDLVNMSTDARLRDIFDDGFVGFDVLLTDIIFHRRGTQGMSDKFQKAARGGLESFAEANNIEVTPTTLLMLAGALDHPNHSGKYDEFLSSFKSFFMKRSYLDATIAELVAAINAGNKPEELLRCKQSLVLTFTFLLQQGNDEKYTDLTLRAAAILSALLKSGTAEAVNKAANDKVPHDSLLPLALRFAMGIPYAYLDSWKSSKANLKLLTPALISASKTVASDFINNQAHFRKASSDDIKRALVSRMSLKPEDVEIIGDENKEVKTVIELRQAAKREDFGKLDKLDNDDSVLLYACCFAYGGLRSYSKATGRKELLPYHVLPLPVSASDAAKIRKNYFLSPIKSETKPHERHGIEAPLVKLLYDPSEFYTYKHGQEPAEDTIHGTDASLGLAGLAIVSQIAIHVHGPQGRNSESLWKSLALGTQLIGSEKFVLGDYASGNGQMISGFEESSKFDSTTGFRLGSSTGAIKNPNHLRLLFIFIYSSILVNSACDTSTTPAVLWKGRFFTASPDLAAQEIYVVKKLNALLKSMADHNPELAQPEMLTYYLTRQFDKVLDTVGLHANLDGKRSAEYKFSRLVEEDAPSFLSEAFRALYLPREGGIGRYVEDRDKEEHFEHCLSDHALSVLAENCRQPSSFAFRMSKHFGTLSTVQMFTQTASQSMPLLKFYLHAHSEAMTKPVNTLADLKANFPAVSTIGNNTAIGNHLKAYNSAQLLSKERRRLEMSSSPFGEDGAFLVTYEANDAIRVKGEIAMVLDDIADVSRAQLGSLYSEEKFSAFKDTLASWSDIPSFLQQEFVFQNSKLDLSKFTLWSDTVIANLIAIVDVLADKADELPAALALLCLLPSQLLSPDKHLTLPILRFSNKTGADATYPVTDDTQQLNEVLSKASTASLSTIERLMALINGLKARQAEANTHISKALESAPDDLKSLIPPDLLIADAEQVLTALAEIRSKKLKYFELPEVPTISELPEVPTISELPEVPSESELPEVEGSNMNEAHRNVDVAHDARLLFDDRDDTDQESDFFLDDDDLS